VLITTYHQAFLNKGGGEYELLEVAMNLRKLGLVADVYSPYSCSLFDYDVVLHFSLHPGGLDLLKEVRAAGKRVILWPNLWLEPGHQEDVGNTANSFLELADFVVVKSESERAVLESIVQLDPEIVITIPTGVDPYYRQSAPSRLFRQSYGVDEFLLWVGIIEPCKNQLRTIEALSAMKMPLFFIGNYRDEEYYKACKKAASEHVRFLPPMSHKSDVLRSAVQECRLYLEPAFEPPGKSVLEAAMAGANIMVSDSAWAREHFNGLATYVDPSSRHSILEGVQEALEKPACPALADQIALKHSLPDVLKPLVDLLSVECSVQDL